MATIFLYLIIAFLVLDTVVGFTLSWLNAKWMRHPIPKVLEGIYDEAKYRRQQQYMIDNRLFGRINDVVELIITLAIVATGLLGWLDTFTTTLTDNLAFQAIIFVIIVNIVATIIDLPFSYYDTFVIEERYSFNKTTQRTFWLDRIKGFLVSIVITGVLLWIVVSLYELWGSRFWVWASLICCAFLLFVNLFYSNLIVPLFNKQTPLPAGELRDAIEAAARKAGFAMKDIYVIDGSKHSTKANAYFTGFGAKRRIVLYDTLLDQLTTDEIVAVLAHEMGHYRHGDTIKQMLLSMATIVIYLFVFSLFVDNAALSEALGGQRVSFALAIVAFGLLLSPINYILSPLSNAYTRRCEYRADRFAADMGMSQPLISGLKKLTAESLGNLTPHPLVVKITYSHPTLEQRITRLMQD